MYIYEELCNKKEIADSYYDIGLDYDGQDNYQEALKSYSAALKIYEEIGDKQGIAFSYNNTGTIYHRQGHAPEALKHYLIALKILEEIGDKDGDKEHLTDRYFNIAWIFEGQKNYPEALKYFFAALKINEKSENKRGIGASCSNIGNTYQRQGNYSEALKYHLLSLKIAEEIGDTKGAASSYNNIGVVYMEQGKKQPNPFKRDSLLNEALKYYVTSLEIRKEIGDIGGFGFIYDNIGGVYRLQGNFPEALKNYLAALEINEEIGNKALIANTYNNIGRIYTEMNRFAEAEKYLNDALYISRELSIKVSIIEAYEFLSQLDSLMGNYQQALEHYKLYTLYKDSLLNETNSKMIEQMKMSYETEKKDKEIQKLESEKEISSLQFIVQQESLKSTQSERDKIQAENLLNLQQVDLLANEKKLQQLEIEKNQADYTAQKAETDRKESQLVILNKEGVIHMLEIKKQKLLKNYLLGGFVLFSLLSLFVYSNYRTRQQLKLQMLRNKIASDLHDDVGSTLSSISIFSQMAQQQSKETIPMLETIGESSRKMLDAMADIVWTITPENDQFEKIILRMRSFAYELLGAKQIDFEFVADDDVTRIKLPMDVRKNLYLIFKEAANNMVKYSEANKALFSIKEEKGFLTMLIRDNGKGFDTNKLTEGNGIKNMKKRALEIGAKLMIDSVLGEGTMIQLKVAV
ncbi:MAG TPA: tetratricopeptide repeat protein [Bacteroidota bacterium]|nr:tetratricopeptide repeat protein [Bacteroidota bacterium]